jgi:hypothetical protein
MNFESYVQFEDWCTLVKIEACATGYALTYISLQDGSWKAEWSQARPP